MITLYNTAIGSLNLGDSIIMDAVTHELSELFPTQFQQNFPTHYPLSSHAKTLARRADLHFVGGTNLLRNYWRWRARKNQWSIDVVDVLSMPTPILLGVGWNTYASKPTNFAKFIYHRLFNGTVIHSVRDEYTKRMLAQCQIHNVINTGCPTLWPLSPEKLSKLPTQRSNQVVFTLTDYRQSPAHDTALILSLAEHYQTLYFWPQGSKDLDYFFTLTQNLGLINTQIIILKSTLVAFNELLMTQPIDYVGTRLHAGIRALQLNRRAHIIAVDNRATEMAVDFKLPVTQRDALPQLIEQLNSTYSCAIRLPDKAIEDWKAQFQRN